MISLPKLQPLRIQSLFILVHFPGQNPAKIVGGEIRFYDFDLLPRINLLIERLLLFLSRISPISIRFLFVRSRSE